MNNVPDDMQPGHNTEGTDCICGPEVLEFCPTCDDEDKEGCWRCGGRGMVEWDGEDGETTLIIIHRDLNKTMTGSPEFALFRHKWPMPEL